MRNAFQGISQKERERERDERKKERKKDRHGHQSSDEAKVF